MKYLLGIAAIVFCCFWGGCSKDSGDKNVKDSTVIPAGYKAYLSKIIATDGTILSMFQRNSDSSLGVVLLSNILTAKFSFFAEGKPSTAGLNDNFSLTPYLVASNAYTINYDAAGLPVSGIRVYNTSSSDKTAIYTTLTDSILFKTAEGKVTEARFYNRTTKMSTLAPLPQYNFTRADTGVVDIYTLTYSGGNIRTIHADRIFSKNVSDYEFVFGNEKGPCYDAPILIVTPDQFISRGYAYMIAFGKNQLLTYRKTDITQGSKTVTNYAYTFNKYLYPTSVKSTDSASAAPATYLFGYSN